MFIAAETLQKERRKLYNAKYIDIVLGLVETGIQDLRDLEEGKIKTAPQDHPDPRSWVWNTMVLFEEGYAEEANRILRACPLRHCEFTPMLLTQIFYYYEPLMDEDVKAKAKEYIISRLPWAAHDRIHPTMYNDNFANMATFTLLAAGEYFGLPEYYAIGRDKLEQFCDLFRRCGSLMEYGSPTYSPIHLLCFAEMQNLLKDPEVREMAAKCEERMWVEMATHYHAETAHLAGPYSRAYTADTVGHPGAICSLFWKVFGDQCFINPINDMFPAHENQVIHISYPALMYPNDAWLVAPIYHFPEYLLPVAMEKKYPYHTEMIVECLSADALAYNKEDEPFGAFGGHRSTNTTYMTKEYSMGTAQQQYHSGSATEGFYVTYQNCDNAKTLMDTGVIYSHYIFNDKRPDHNNLYAYYGENHRSGYRDEGRKFGLQHENTALVVYKPLHLEAKHVRSARLTAFVPSHFFQDFKLIAGCKPVILPYESEEPVTVCLQAHHSLFAFVPLELTNLGRKAAVRIENKDQHLQISFYNYEGEERSFEFQELIHTCNGFVCVAGTTEEYGSLEVFARYVSEVTIEDRMELSAKLYTRRIKVKNHGTELYFVYNPLTENIIVSTANKKPKGLHIFKADMLDETKLPFLNE